MLIQVNGNTPELCINVQKFLAPLQQVFDFLSSSINETAYKELNVVMRATYHTYAKHDKGKIVPLFIYGKTILKVGPAGIVLDNACGYAASLKKVYHYYGDKLKPLMDFEKELHLGVKHRELQPLITFVDMEDFEGVKAEMLELLQVMQFALQDPNAIVADLKAKL